MGIARATEGVGLAGMDRIIGWIAHLNRIVPLFYKVLIANAALIAAGALAAAWALTRAPSGVPVPGLTPATVILAGAIGVSILVNYLLMRLAFHPLFELRQTMEAVRRGQLSARAPSDAADPDVAELAVTFNIMIEELERYRRSASSVILRALEEERKRFARELHDETSQALTSLVIRLEMLMESLHEGRDQQLVAELRRLRDLAANTLNETRRLTFDLRPTILDDLGLVPALRWLIKDKLEPEGLQASFEVVGFDQRLPDEVETTLFRIVQEALSNVVRHAQAQHVAVSLQQKEDRLVVTVVDDGRGFDVRSIRPDDPRGRGLGLFGMRERAELVGGQLHVSSVPGRGTRVEVIIPFRKERKTTDDGAHREPAHSRVDRG